MHVVSSINFFLFFSLAFAAIKVTIGSAYNRWLHLMKAIQNVPSATYRAAVTTDASIATVICIGFVQWMEVMVPRRGTVPTMFVYFVY